MFKYVYINFLITSYPALQLQWQHQMRGLQLPHGRKWEGVWVQYCYMTLKCAGKGIRGIFKFHPNTQAQETLPFLVFFWNQTQSVLSSHPAKVIKTFISGMGSLLIPSSGPTGKAMTIAVLLPTSSRWADRSPLSACLGYLGPPIFFSFCLESFRYLLCFKQWPASSDYGRQYVLWMLQN